MRRMAVVTRGGGRSQGSAVRVLRVVGVVPVVAVALVLVGCGTAARAGSLHTLRAAEAAFYRAGLPFQAEWTPNPYLRPHAPPSPVPMPKPLFAHLTGLAGASDPVRFTESIVFVFDGPAPALAFSGLAGREHFLVIRADNVVYVGARLPAAMRAMTQLRRQ